MDIKSFTECGLACLMKSNENSEEDEPDKKNNISKELKVCD